MEGSHRTYLHSSLAGPAVESGSSLRESSLGEGLSVCALSRVRLCTLIDCSPPGSVGFSRLEYWSRLPFPSPGDFPDSGIKPTSLVSLAWAGRFYTIITTWVIAAEFLERLAIHIKGKFVCFLFCFVLFFWPPSAAICSYVLSLK